MALDQKLGSLSITNLVLNPIVTAPLLWVLTSGPPTVRDRLTNVVTSLRDPQTLSSVVKALKVLLALGVAGAVNQKLNQLALNSWRVKSEKKRWNWSQEIAVVTGGCSGIGERTVKRLINKGVKVAVLDIQQLPPGLQGYANVKFFACDITDPNAVNSTAERIKASMGSPTILVNNAGIAKAHSIFNTTPEELRKIFDVNCLSNWYTVQAFLPGMIEKNKGHVVTVASTASYVGIAGMADYCATKAATLAFHEVLNQELRLKYHAPNILTTSVHPVWVRTPLIASYEKALRATGTPIIEPQAVADAVANQIFKCSGAQLFLPSGLAKLTQLRGFPNWIQERLRGGVAKTILQCTE